MISILFAESGDNLAHLIRFYAPSARRLLDVTYGAGTLTKRCPIPVIGIDNDPDTAPAVRADATQLPFLDGSFEAAVFDPPYLYGSTAMHMGLIGGKTWSNKRSTWKRPEHLINMAIGVAGELRRVLAPNGVAITKIMDSRFKGRLVRNHDHVIDMFETAGFTLHDQLVYIRTVTGSFVNTKTAQSAHGYFLIFKNTPAKVVARAA